MRVLPRLRTDELDSVNDRLAAAIDSFHGERFSSIRTEGVRNEVGFGDQEILRMTSMLSRQISGLKAEKLLIRTDVMRLKELFVEIKSGFVPNSIQLPIRSQVREGALLPTLAQEIKSLRGEVFCWRDAVNCLIEQTAIQLTDGFGRFLLSKTEPLREKLRVEIALRRKLHNTVLELKGNIRVFVRVRPLLAPEISAGKSSCITVESENDLMISKGGQTRTFAFDRVFDACTSNTDLFSDLHQLLISSLDGFNVAILAYGITGSGKTFTMAGIYERLGLDLFHEKTNRESSGGWRYTFEATVCEVYNENIADLLNIKNLDCSLRTNPVSGLFFIPGLTRVKIESPGDIAKLMVTADRNRAVSSTNCNESSSRSHLITTIHLSIVTPSLKQIDSKMNLVDLAGSERLDKSGATGAVAKEGMFINKSLSALGDVISARVNRSSHVPYRNSVLTSALQDCIAGESKTLMILQVNPSHECAEETINSLVFASRVRDVEMPKTMNSPRKRV